MDALVVVGADGRLWSAPYGSEFLGWHGGVPMAYYRAGWVGPMVDITGRTKPSKEN